LVFKNIFKKFTRNYRDNGLASALQKSLIALVAFAYESRAYRIYRKEIDPSMDPGMAPPHPFKLHVLGTGDSDFISMIEEMEEWLDGKVLEMLDGGSLCVLLLDGEKVAGFNLFSVGEVYMPLVKTKRTFRSHEAWSEQITVHQDYRGMGLATILRLQAFMELGNRGIRKFYGGTLPSNIANRKLSKKVGFREIADIHYRKVFGSTNWFVKRVRDEI
jgi:ribosomal protein S18 acetylase RimI-like enzyme